jgi:hypothetical protein
MRVSVLDCAAIAEVVLTSSLDCAAIPLTVFAGQNWSRRNRRACFGLRPGLRRNRRACFGLRPGLRRNRQTVCRRESRLRRNHRGVSARVSDGGSIVGGCPHPIWIAAQGERLEGDHPRAARLPRPRGACGATRMLASMSAVHAARRSARGPQGRQHCVPGAADRERRYGAVCARTAARHVRCLERTCPARDLRAGSGSAWR